jgi:hypothetical protein
MNWIANLPLRKLGAGVVTLIVLIVILHSVKTGTDIPDNTADLLKVVFSVSVGGYVGSSAYEAVRRPWDRWEEEHE